MIIKECLVFSERVRSLNQYITWCQKWDLSKIKGPREMDFTCPNNVSEMWQRWRSGMEYFLAATCSRKSEAERVAIFMCMIGKGGQEVKNTFEFERAEDGTEIVTTKILFEKFEAYCKPRWNLVVDRHRFLTRDQQPSESIDQFVTELRTLAASCEWGELKDDLTCSRIVSGISSNTVRERLLRSETDLTLQKAIDICRIVQLSKQQMKLFGGETVQAGVSRVRHQSTSRPEEQRRKQSKHQKSKQTPQGSTSNNADKECGNCGSKHPEGRCRAFGKRCNNWKKLNHYAKVCRSGINLVQQVETGDDHFCLESIKASLDSLDSRSRKSREKSSEYVTLLIDGQETSLKLDTGAAVNVISYATFKKILAILAGVSKTMLRKPKAKLTAYNGQDIPITAVCDLSCKHKDVTYGLEFYITSMKSEPVLSVSACRELGLIKFVKTLKEETADQFSA